MLIGKFEIPGTEESFNIIEEFLRKLASNYLSAIEEASLVYNFLVEKKGNGNFVPEVSCAKTDTPQSPIELFFILKLLADHLVPAQIITPRFSGCFNKEVDYVGDLQ